MCFGARIVELCGPNGSRVDIRFMEVLCKSDTTLLELQVIVAGRLEQPVSKLRLVSEGERMAGSETVASVLLRHAWAEH